jgi:hypothetical protein
MHTHAQITRFRFFLANHGIPVVQQLPFSPDMAPCDFWLFPKLEMALKGKRFDDNTFEENMTSDMSSIPKDCFKRCFQQWPNRWHKCIASEGAYFEED